MSSNKNTYDYNAALTKRKQEFMDAVKPLNSVPFYEFVERDERISQAFLDSKPQLLDKYHYKYPWNPLEADLIAWIKRILIQQNVVGNYLIAFTHPPMPFGRVHLNASYDWVEPLWKANYGFYFCNLSQNKQLDFHIHEGDFEANLKEIADLERGGL